MPKEIIPEMLKYVFAFALAFLPSVAVKYQSGLILISILFFVLLGTFIGLSIKLKKTKKPSISDIVFEAFLFVFALVFLFGSLSLGPITITPDYAFYAGVSLALLTTLLFAVEILTED